ncbi:MAG TPA: DUF167 domain-containing protein [Solirubrobacterales bacterium]|nr:DUF167 domain-containing protein [Solirubrobacterales bacterium]HMX70354.1 DUF167 domain-containing protein [Solirubrobacterales bacterium]HNA23735.1 DUF167 domain-containing protein [Solirubrobacterales bacterium]HNA44253.1 DUF167 domain-containing protein [Solirubrobacterales bacterium]HNC05356.1 DUF167 domain-containing protein [Solirubrobacterales bacterium]
MTAGAGGFSRRIRVRLQPRASKNELKGWKEDPGSGEQVLQARVTAPPVDGKANQALIALLAKEFKTPKTRIRIIQGESARDKVVELAESDRDGHRP